MKTMNLVPAEIRTKHYEADEVRDDEKMGTLSRGSEKQDTLLTFSGNITYPLSISDDV